jgi:hypothetical protein
LIEGSAVTSLRAGRPRNWAERTRMIPKSGNRFPACVKPSQLAGPSFKASAGEGRSDRIIRKQLGRTSP